jgi:hypothetical protein
MPADNRKLFLGLFRLLASHVPPKSGGAAQYDRCRYFLIAWV